MNDESIINQFHQMQHIISQIDRQNVAFYETLIALSIILITIIQRL